jgi:hypothetical protein
MMKSFSSFTKIFKKSFSLKSTGSERLENPFLRYNQAHKSISQQYFSIVKHHKLFHNFQLKNFTSQSTTRDTINHDKDRDNFYPNNIQISYPSNMKPEEFKIAESIKVTSACIEVFIFN